MKILLIHNYYRTSAPSGEDVVVRNERQMLEKRGHEVIPLEGFNDDLQMETFLEKCQVAAKTLWSWNALARVRTAIKRHRPDVVHVHNTFPQFSPSIYWAFAPRVRTPVIQTLHNFRLLCPNGLFLRAGKACEDCMQFGLQRALKHRCYRSSILGSGTVAGMLKLHRVIGTFDRGVDRYIALSRFAADKFATSGFLPGTISIKPNFLPAPPEPGCGGGGYALYVGRLSEGKGVATLLAAWGRLQGHRLEIVGDGRLMPQLRNRVVATGGEVAFLGARSRPDVLERMRRADLVIVPSECYEGFPMVIAEAYACGTPVIASRNGSLTELIIDGETGRTFRTGDPEDLAETVRGVLADQEGLAKLRAGARNYFESHLTEENNYRQLMAIYENSIQWKNRSVEDAVVRPE